MSIRVISLLGQIVLNQKAEREDKSHTLNDSQARSYQDNTSMAAGEDGKYGTPLAVHVLAVGEGAGAGGGSAYTAQPSH